MSRRLVVGMVAAGLVAVAVLAGLLLVGRPQLAAVAPPAGKQEVLIRAAGLDLLTERGIALGQAPACRTEQDAIVCDGTTADGQPVGVTGPAVAPVNGPAVVTVSVAGRPVASGPAQDVVDDAASAR